MKGKLIKVTPLSKKFHNVFRFTRRTAEVSLDSGKIYRFVRHVLETGRAVSILPYFQDRENKKWYVVLVRQYRPAVDALSLEAPGGLLKEGKEVRREMARELREEAGIEVRPQDIVRVGDQHVANSFCDQEVHLGIIELKHRSARHFFKDLPYQHGVRSEREFTEVVVLPLRKLIQPRSKEVGYTLTQYQLLDLARRLKQL